MSTKSVLGVIEDDDDDGPLSSVGRGVVGAPPLKNVKSRELSMFMLIKVSIHVC